MRIRERILEREKESEKPLACSFLVLLIFCIYKIVDKISDYFFYIYQSVDKIFPNLSIFLDSFCGDESEILEGKKTLGKGAPLFLTLTSNSCAC